MSVSSRASLLLVFSLLFGLWTAAVHGPDHDTALAHADDCVVCVFAQGLGSGASAAAPSLVLADVSSVIPVVGPWSTIYGAPRAQVRARGPPLNPV